MANEILLNKQTVNNLLIKDNKIISQISKGAKSYLMVDKTGQNQLYFTIGNESISRYSLMAQTDGPIAFFFDFQKFLNSLQKISFNENIILKLTEKSVIIKSDSCNDKVTLSINVLDLSEIKEIIDLENEKHQLDSNNNFIVNEALESFLKASNSLMANTSADSSVFLSKESGIYADRSVVFIAKDIDFNNNKDIFLHNNSIKFCQVTKGNNNFYTFLEEANAIRWTSENQLIRTYFVQSEADLALPSDEDLESITPKADNSMKISVGILLNAIEFFNGFYEGSIWKPLDFTVEAGSSQIKLSYSHSSAEIEKFIDAESDFKYNQKFSIASDSIKSILSVVNSDSEVTFIFEKDAPGILMTVDNFWCLLADILD